MLSSQLRGGHGALAFGWKWRFQKEEEQSAGQKKKKYGKDSRIVYPDASSPPPQQLNIRCPLPVRIHRSAYFIFPPPPHWLLSRPILSRLCSCWLLHPIEFSLTLMMRFVDAGMPAFVASIVLVSPNFFTPSKPSTRQSTSFKAKQPFR